jgi:hypothetical protein
MYMFAHVGAAAALAAVLHWSKVVACWSAAPLLL